MNLVSFGALSKLKPDQVGPPHGDAKRGPELRFERANAIEASSLAGVDAITGVAPRKPLVAARNRLATAARRQDQRHPAHRAVGHGDVEPTTFPAALHGDERTEDRDRRLQAAASDVRD